MRRLFILLVLSGLLISIVHPARSYHQTLSSSAEHPELVLLDRIPDEMYPAFLDLVTWVEAHTNTSQKTYRVSSFHHDGAWALATLSILPSAVSVSDWVTAPEHLFVILQKTHVWQASVPAMSNFDTLLRQVPDEILTAQAKTTLRPEAFPSHSHQPTESWKFPWPTGEAWKFTQGWHKKHPTFYLPYAVDFAPASGADARILAAHGGTVLSVCEGTRSRNVHLRADDGTETAYLHIDPATLNVHQGQTIPQGFVLGEALAGFDNDECGSWQGQHLHFEVASQTITMDGWTSSPENVWNHPVHGTATDGYWFTSSNEPIEAQSVVEGVLNPLDETISGSVDITGWADSNLPDVEQVEIVINGTYTIEPTFTSDTAWSWTWDTTQFGNGNYHIAVRVTTASGSVAWLAVDGADAHELLVTVENPQHPCLQPLYRYVWPAMHSRHVYSSVWEELDVGDEDWTYEGIEGYVARTATCYMPDSVALHRLYSQEYQKHVMTISVSEAEGLIAAGTYVSETIVGYVAPEPQNPYPTCPLYRLYSAERDDHFYTCSEDQKQHALEAGFVDEGPEGYLFSSTANIAPRQPQLTSPEEGATISTHTVELVWEDRGDPDSYPRGIVDFEVHMTQSGSTWEQTRAWSESTTWTVEVPENGEYCWRVQAGDGDLLSGWTESRCLTVEALTIDVFLPVLKQ